MAIAKIGVMGGTFDPIHHGHLVVAEEVWSTLALDRVLFVPAGEPPHKRDRPVTDAAHRVAMVERALAGNPHFALSRVDVDRAGPSYSVDTLAALRQQLGAEVSLFFIIGLDSLIDLLTWHAPARLLALARIVAVGRPGYEGGIAALGRHIPGAAERIEIVPVPQLAIASSDLRRRVREGRPISYQVPRAVEDYIREEGLYREMDGEASGLRSSEGGTSP